MSTFQERLNAAAEQTTCQILRAGGSALVQAGAWNLATGAPGVAALSVGSVALLASNYACDWDPNGPSTLPEAGGIAGGQCMETEGCDLMLRRNNDSGPYTGPVRKLISSVRSGTYPNGTPKVTTTWINCDGEQVSDDESESSLWPLTTEVREGGVCVGDPSPAPEPDYPEYEYDEPDGPNGEPGCSLTVNVLGWGQLADGTAAPIYKISPKTEVRADGGRIGGCNFEPVIYYNPQGPGGPDTPSPPHPPTPPIPFPPGPQDDDDPEWLRLLKNALAGAAGNLLASAIKALLEKPYAGVKYEMLAPCDFAEDGTQLLWEGEIPEQKFNAAVLDRLDAISNQVSQHLTWKTPICPPAEPELEGEWRKISFRSDEVSPYGKSCLRKYLRYRSVSGLGLGELVDYWKAFTWTSGATRVRHSGASWGTVEVWAASFDEGKRVIQHAAGEAGIDTAQTGRWSSRVSSSSRLGVSLLMRVDTTGGYYWITEREGSSGRPLVAYPHNQ